MLKPGIILQHGPLGPPGRLGEFLERRGLAHRVHPLWSDPVPDLSGAGWVASLGSEFSAAAQEPTWVAAEIEALRGAVAAGVPVLGLCFGGQTLAVALGGGVHPNEEPEIGWVPVESDDPEIPAGPWAQFHFENLEVPPGARELARSPAGPAAFRAGPHLGLQFHPEVDFERMHVWLHSEGAVPAGFDRAKAIREGERHAARAGEQAFELFDAWFRRLDHAKASARATRSRHTRPTSRGSSVNMEGLKQIVRKPRSS